ncbi:MAG: FAD-binding oxidoreductase [Acidimicrobiales bacterium]
MTEPHRGEPTPPIAFSAGDVGRHLPGPRVDVPDAVAARLSDVCPVVSAAADLAEAGRDWWPLALHWAVAGETPAPPALIVRPTSADEVASVLRICNDARIPVTPVAGRSGVCGASIPVFGGVALDTTAMAGIVDVDDASMLLRVRPGTFGDVLEDALRSDHAATLGHWPQSMQLSTVGGWLACRSAGQYSTRYGKIEDMVAGLDVALADGRLVRLGGRAPRSAVGPDLTQVIVGSEGTLGVITDATLRIHPVPRHEERQAWGFGSFADGLDACRRILRRGATPAVLRLYDTTETARTFELETNALIVLDEGDPGLVEATMAVVASECTATPGVVRLGSEPVGHWLERRNDVSALPALVSRGIVLDTIEIAAHWSALGRIYTEGVGALQAIDGMLAASAHQSHAYSDGACLYFTWAVRPSGDIEGPYRAAWDAVTNVTLANGGALSHHHGVGLNRSRYVSAALGPAALEMFTAIKGVLDPNGILNPGKFGLASPWGPSPWP